MEKLTIIGGGLAGSEAAWQAAQRGIQVPLYEMRPRRTTGAHLTDQLGELICSNSLGSNQPDRASGVLKEELRLLHSLILECAEASTIPAGGALAVDRDAFASKITQKIIAHPNINLIRQECTAIPAEPAIIASGPLTSPALSQAIAALTGQESLFFFDAIAPIVSLDSPTSPRPGITSTALLTKLNSIPLLTNSFTPRGSIWKASKASRRRKRMPAISCSSKAACRWKYWPIAILKV